MPLIVYLHGGSAKGDDIRKLIQNGFCKGVYDGDFDDTNAYILFPQLDSKYRGWENAARAVKQLIDFTVRTYEIDSENISLTGHSMGGTRRVRAGDCLSENVRAHRADERQR